MTFAKETNPNKAAYILSERILATCRATMWQNWSVYKALSWNLGWFSQACVAWCLNSISMD